MSTRLWILGASDPEMDAIETLLRECGENVEYAVDARGDRVQPATAYRAVRGALYDCADVTYEVECMVEDRASIESERCFTIDHHRLGDPGYGRPPSEFLAASSIGQVIAELARLGQLPKSWPVTDSGVPSIVGSIAARQGRAATVTRGLASMMGVPQWYGQIIPRDIVLTAAADHCLEAAYRGECPGVDPDALARFYSGSR